MANEERVCVWDDNSGTWLPECKDSLTYWQLEVAESIYIDITAGFCPWCGGRIAILDETGMTELGRR